MLNLLHMDLHRMGRSAATWVLVACAALVGLFCVAMTDGDIQAMADDPQYLAEIQAAGSEDRTVGIYVESDANWISGPIGAGDVVSAEFHSGLPALLCVIFTALFVFAEQKNGYVKNIAGQFPHRGMLAASKLLAVALVVLLFLGAFTLAVLLAGQGFWGDRFQLDALPALGKLLGVQYLLHLGLCALVLLLTVVLRGSALPMVVGILAVLIFGMGYSSDRITTWMNPWDDALGDGMQTVQSLLAVGSGGLTGLGLGNGRQKFLYLPEAQNDFIFAIVCEELGLVGACLILALFALLIIRGYWLALHARDKFGSLVIVGITTLFAFQVFANVAVVTNLFPVTGISMPFFSYGGTALIIQMAEMCLILGISRQTQVT